jgi:hypothetical protein
VRALLLSALSLGADHDRPASRYGLAEWIRAAVTSNVQHGAQRRTYRGALFWRMSAGMGDIVFAPLYQVLKQRGVRFEFFHRLRNVALAPRTSDELSYVEALEFDLQARVKGGGEYQPLVDVHGVPSWPLMITAIVAGRHAAEGERAVLIRVLDQP